MGEGESPAHTGSIWRYDNDVTAEQAEYANKAFFFGTSLENQFISYNQKLQEHIKSDQTKLLSFDDI